MIKRYFSIIAFSFVAFTSCVNDVIPENPNVNPENLNNHIEITFTAIGGDLVKTALNHDEVLWETGDAIKVIWGDNKSVKSIGEVYNSQLNAAFKATVEESEAYYAVYPYDIPSSFSGGYLTVTIPETQSGLFRDNSIIVAKADESNQMHFRHTLSYLEFSIDTPGELTFSCGNPVAGSVKVSFNNDKSVNHTAVEGGETITLNIENSGTYYIAMLPDVKLDNLVFQLTNSSGTKYINAPFDRQMSRGKILGIGNITEKFGGFSVGATFETFEIVEFDFNF